VKPLFFLSLLCSSYFSVFSDPDVFLGLLNLFAAVTSILWIQYIQEGGGNDNAIILFMIIFFINCLGICIVFIRRRISWKQEKEEEEDEEEEEKKRDQKEGKERKRITAAEGSHSMKRKLK
jgi:Na+-transporting methylmalonyl-CoA/oxaloacetate decarboxylase gamma subunit